MARTVYAYEARSIVNGLVETVQGVVALPSNQTISDYLWARFPFLASATTQEVGPEGVTFPLYQKG